ncbi:unnamed protein product [Ectocarpus sp. CCAP 1310/34]|nr:unnamed protein product [Ectocarpus sp. CCAP 1310/34]
MARITRVPQLRTCIVEDPFNVERFLVTVDVYTAVPNTDDLDRFMSIAMMALVGCSSSWVTLGPRLPAVTASRSSGVRMTKSRLTVSRLAHMSVGSVGEGEPSEGTPLASENARGPGESGGLGMVPVRSPWGRGAGGGASAPARSNAKEEARREATIWQAKHNQTLWLTKIAGLLKNFWPESGQDGSRGPGGSGGLGLVPVPSPWGGGAGGGASAPARSNAKEEPRREATIWQAKYNQKLWVLRGQRGPEPGPQKEDLQGLMGDIVHVTGDVLAQMRAFSSSDVKSFRPVGVARTSSIADNFDEMCEAVMPLVKFGLDSSTTTGVKSLRRLEPVAIAMTDTRSRFRTTLVRNSDVFPDEYQRAALPRLPNEDVKLWQRPSSPGCTPSRRCIFRRMRSTATPCRRCPSSPKSTTSVNGG